MEAKWKPKPQQPWIPLNTTEIPQEATSGKESTATPQTSIGLAAEDSAESDRRGQC